MFISSLYSQLTLNLDFTFTAIDSNDELINFQLLENDELVVGFNNEDIFRIVNYGCDGDTVYTFSFNKLDNEDLENFKIFSINGNDYLITCSNFDRWSDPGLHNRIVIRIFDLVDFTEIIAYDYDNNCYGWIENDYPTVNFIETINQQNNAQVIIGYNEGWTEGYAVDPWSYEKSFIARFNFSSDELQFIEVLPNIGLEIQFIGGNNNYASLGFVNDSGGLEAPYNYWYYYLKIIDNQTPANVITIANITGYKRDFTILTDGYYDLNLGHLVYIRPEEPFATLINYSNDFSEIIWERVEAENGMNKITASREIPTNQGNHFVIYFRKRAYKIINRITGSTVLEDNLSYPIIEILRKADEELLFISNIQTNLFNVYTLDGEIQVSVNDEHIPNTISHIRNFPNPFNNQTTIKFSLKNNSKVDLSIYNIKGQKIKTLTNNDFTKGSHSIIWNGDDDFGKPVSSGIYLYKLNINNKTETLKKCILVK